MNDRKLHVIRMAHELFIEKGFQATSIQDILEYSGISKGTFYNYFSSKNELFIALFRTIYERLEKERNDLLVGQDPGDVAIFVEQIELQLLTNRKNKLIPLFEEVIVSDDEDLKQFIQERQLRMLRWYYQRFLDLFGTEKEPYLLDCAIMFMGILHQNLKFYTMAHHQNVNIHKVVQYSVGRLVQMVEDISSSREQLLDPGYLQEWLPEKNKVEADFSSALSEAIAALRSSVTKGAVPPQERDRSLELLAFIQEELLNAKKPRTFLLESALNTLKGQQSGVFTEVSLENLEKLIKGS